MTRQICAAVLSAVFVTAGAAQGQRDAQTSSVDVTGCVQRISHSGTLGTTISGTGTTPERAGALANTAEPANGFQLADAAPFEAASTTRPRPRGTTGTEPRTTYVLEGNDDQLSGHVGHRVHVKGTLVPPHDRESGGARVPAASGATGSDQVKSGTQLLKISSIERLADSCKAR